MPHNNFLHSSCFNIPGAPEQLPAFIWFYIWFHRGPPKVPPPPVPLHSFPHSCGFNISASPRLSTASCMHRHLGSIYLGFRFSSQQLLAFILVSMSNFPLSHLPFSHQFSAGPSFLMLSTSKNEEVSQTCFVFDVGKFKHWESLAELLRVWCCQFWKMKKFRRIARFLTLSSSNVEEVSQNCFVFDVVNCVVEEVWQNSLVFRLADRQVDR